MTPNLRIEILQAALECCPLSFDGIPGGLNRDFSLFYAGLGKCKIGFLLFHVCPLSRDLGLSPLHVCPLSRDLGCLLLYLSTRGHNGFLVGFKIERLLI